LRAKRLTEVPPHRWREPQSETRRPPFPGRDRTGRAPGCRDVNGGSATVVGRGHRASRGDDAGHGLGQYGSELEAGSGHVADAARLCTLDTIRVRPRKAAVVRSDGARPIADSLPVDLEVPPGEGVRDGGDDSGVE